MFSVRAVVSFLAAATVMTGVLAAPNPPVEVNNCNIGQAYCCDQTYDSSDENFLSMWSFLGIVAPVEGPKVGVQCNPISNIVGDVKGCQASAVCCSGNSFNGLVNVGCNSINV
ncbi:hydrophobin [Serendipita vermifera]|nr:hydrophobin [Serendipita vermifera]